MMWYPGKRTFRVGYVHDSEWNADKILSGNNRSREITPWDDGYLRIITTIGSRTGGSRIIYKEIQITMHQIDGCNTCGSIYTT